MSRRQKVDKAREELERAAFARAGDPLPDPGVTCRFDRWSSALKALVSKTIDMNGWTVTEWIYDPNCTGVPVFAFHYDGREGDHMHPMFISTRMRIDTRLDIAGELARLSDEALRYRVAASRMAPIWQHPTKGDAIEI